MIKVAGLKKAYGEQVIFDDVSFFIGQGERIGLVGRNGHGKTTLFRMILGLEEPDAGEIIVPRYYRTGHLSQHISFSEDTVLKECSLSLPKSEDGVDETYKVKVILAGLGMGEDYFDLNPSELSGGYQIRLNLAKVLTSSPNLLLLDEPTNYLDIVSIRWLKKFLTGWRNELVLITHDREFMDSVTTHTMAIHRTKIRKIQGPTRKLYGQIEQEEEIHEKTRANEEKKRIEAEKFINRFRAQATKASAVQSRIKALDKKEKLERLDEIETLDFRFNSAPFHAKRLMDVEDLSFGFEEGALLFSGLGFSVNKGDRIAVVGKNGKGKTTLLNVLAGEFKPLGGEVRRHPNLKLAYFGQTNIERLDREKTVEEEMMDSHPDNNRAAARRVCGIMMFERDKALKKIGVLSGGEKSRVLLGKLLLSPANMLLLDEPTNHLDMDSIDSLVEAISSFSGAVAIVTHSEMILNAIANRLIVFDGGKVSLFEGSYRDFLERVGWESEALEEGAKANKTKPVKGVNKKELRKMRAQAMADRQKTLGNLERSISELEYAIVNTEKMSEEIGRELTLASENGDAEKIPLLSRAYHESSEKIDSLFDELESLTKERDLRTKEFEARLSSTEEQLNTGG